MMPQLVTYRQRRRDGSWLRLYVPVLPVLVLLLPLLVLAALAGLVACFIYRVDAVGALRGIGHVVGALSGTRLDIEDSETAVRIHVM